MKSIFRILVGLGVAITLLLTQFACTGGLANTSTEPPTPLQPWVIDSNYWAVEGNHPVLLLGAGVDPLFRSNYAAILKENQRAGGNYAECTLRPDPFGHRRPFTYDTLSGGYDLTRIDSAYWSHILTVVAAAANEGITLNLHGRYGQFFPEYMRADSLKFRTAFARQSQKVLRGQSHVVITEPPGLIAQPQRPTAHREWFARRLLTGDGAVDYPHPPGQATDFSRGLSAIRAARRVESLIKFWDLRPAPEILLDGNAPTTTAAADSAGNYVIHLAAPTRARIRLNTQVQVPIRFTVIGYLGTQRSEVLQPPYGSVFELSTEDEQGAWLVMRRLPEGS